ncbi:amidase family protein [Gordonia hankookensis]|uniref:Glutamyl-tRNA amidotransferase n=1 Tax=Gordonia hankookensis TaxID=589403 RepID=A0ABR7WCX9_9ACTN|nr:amidase family protein [Gordonia hankookensis]MBD1320651.1 glutamyl-tRNA amidotransferase [Gordonia hankookensis]
MPTTVGPLHGETVAVKDVFGVAGVAIGAGLRDFLAERVPEPDHAAAVHTLLDAGASVTGVAQTDAFAYSITGTSNNYGTPMNLAAPGRIPGGSSSGPSAAVAHGHATIGLGTDTAGSIRVPAAYQNLWGLRTTHGAMDTVGMVPLAPSFDTVGWITRDGATLARVVDAALVARSAIEESAPAAPVVLDPALIAAADDEVADEIMRYADRFDADHIDLGLDLDDCRDTFTTVQAYEAWQSHGNWVAEHPTALPADIAARFAIGRAISARDYMAARHRAHEIAARLRSAVESRVLLLPTATTIPAPTDADADALRCARETTLQLTCLASIGGLPAVTFPSSRSRLPIGICLVGAPHTDRSLVRLARRCAGGDDQTDD